MTLPDVDCAVQLYLLVPGTRPGQPGQGWGRPRTPADSRRQLRWLLSLVSGLPLDELDLVEGAYGKPRLADPGRASRFAFSKADAAGAVLLATTNGSPIGVDLEAERSIAERDLIIDGYLHPDEAAAIRSQPAAEQDGAFLRTWVRKEAFLKAVGLGMSIDLGSFAVTAPDGKVRTSEPLPAVQGSWWCTDLDLPKPWVGAVCTNQSGVSLEYHQAALNGLDLVSNEWGAP